MLIMMHAVTCSHFALHVQSVLMIWVGGMGRGALHDIVGIHVLETLSRLNTYTYICAHLYMHVSCYSFIRMKTAWWEQNLLCLTVLLGELQMDLVKEEGVVHGAVHAGFYEALFFPLMDPEHSVFQKICIALVAALKDNKKKLFITGHSLGECICKASCCIHNCCPRNS